MQHVPLYRRKRTVPTYINEGRVRTIYSVRQETSADHGNEIKREGDDVAQQALTAEALKRLAHALKEGLHEAPALALLLHIDEVDALLPEDRVDCGIPIVINEQ
jgi:hypothetical protein